MLMSESHGYDVTVNTIALEDFDYIESIISVDKET